MAAIAAGAAVIALIWTGQDRKRLHKQQDAFTKEHAQFLAELTARARFELSLRVSPVARSVDELAVAERPGVDLWQRFEVAIDNRRGTKAAGATVLEVLVPADPMLSARWTNPDGVERTDRGVSTPAEETLSLDDTVLPAQRLTLEVPRVGIRVPRIFYFRCVVSAPTSRMPIRIRATADELPDDVEAVVLDRVFEVRDPQQPSELRGRPS